MYIYIYANPTHAHCRLKDLEEEKDDILMSPCKFLKMNDLTSCEIQTLEIQIELMQTQSGG